MLFHLPEERKEKVYIALVTLTGLLRFINLGFLDLQAWDEALYAVRAEGILQFGGWIDQTSFAIDGLYSSLPPPLYVWLTAISFHTFGVNEFAARFFSAAFGVLTLFIIYLTGKKIANPDVGLLTALLFGFNPFVSFFARQGQFDTALVFFLSLSTLYLIYSDYKNAVQYAVLAGISIGAALMTKLYVGLSIPLAYAFWIFLKNSESRSRSWQVLTIMLLTATLVAAPWHVYMTLAHGNGNPLFFLKASALWERTVAGIEGNVKPLEIFYYVNQFFVLFPVGASWLGYGLWKIFRTKDQSWSLLSLWFATFFIVFSLVRTKLAVYLLPMLLPASLIAAQEIWKAAKNEISTRTLSILVGSTLLSVLWSSSQTWRNAVKGFIKQLVSVQLPNGSEIEGFLPFFLLALSILLFSLFLFRTGWIEHFRRPLSYLIIVPSFVWSLFHIAYQDRFQWKDGGKELGDYVQMHSIERILVAGYERNPQLTYYLQGVDIGWRDDFQFRRIIPPKDRSLFRSWLRNETAQEPPAALLVIEKDKLIRYETIEPMNIVPPDYELVFESRRYAGFQRQKLVHIATNRE